jgi:hypothetical protein
MTLARSIAHEPSALPLITAKNKLTQAVIDRLAKYDINGAYVETKLCDDVDVDEFIDPSFASRFAAK